MIYVKLHGRLGNNMFCIATAATIAKIRGEQFVACCHNDYSLTGGETFWEYIQQFRNNIFSKVTILPELPKGLPLVKQSGFAYEELNLPKGDCIIEGSFQSYKYIDEKVAQELFYLSNIVSEIKEENKDVFSEPIVSINVRRGDYCTMPHKLPPVSKTYVKRAMSMFPKHTRFLMLSDDYDYCRANFKGDNIYYLKESSVLKDLFATTLCQHNIISNSTFAWWGAFLNPSPNKKVIAPTPWFGRYAKNKESNVQDLIPTEWIELKNSLDFDLKVKAIKLGLLTDFKIIR